MVAPVRALHCITTTCVGGAERFLADCLRRWRDDPRFARPAVVGLGPPGPLADEYAALGAETLNLGLRPGRPPSPFAPLRFFRFVRAFDPGVVVGWMYHGDAMAHWAWRWRGRRPGLVWTAHQTPDDLSGEKPLTRRLIRWCARRSGDAGAMVYVAGAALRRHGELGFDPTRARVIPNGFDLDRFRPDAAARLDVRRELGLPPDAPLVGRVARFHPMKDFDACLAAFARLRAIRPDAALALAGEGASFDSGAFARLAAAHGFPGADGAARQRLFALGRRSDMPRLNAAFDVATSSSRTREALPLALGEAMACGVPCVATDVGDSAELLGDAGLVVRPGDPAALAAAWERVLALPSDARARLGEAARARIAEKFSLAGAAEAYAGLFLDTR